VFPWISQERTRILASRGFIWIFAGILFDLMGCFFGIRFKRGGDQTRTYSSETSSSINRLRFLIALLSPIVYLNLPDLFRETALVTESWPSLNFNVRLLFSGCLFLLAIIFILPHDDWVKRWFKFCGLPVSFFTSKSQGEENGEGELRNRWEKVCYGFIYGSLGIFVINLCLYKPEWLPIHWLPDDVLVQNLGIGRRLMWCFGWGIAGLSIAAISDARRKRGDVKSPFPSYVYFYPSFVIVNSLVIFGLLTLIAAKGVVYYSIAAFFSLNLGFWIDSVNFNKLVEGLLNQAGKLFSANQRSK
jgi:hypothetical protein